jgi:hypothetical protein
VAKDHSQY